MMIRSLPVHEPHASRNAHIVERGSVSQGDFVRMLQMAGDSVPPSEAPVSKSMPRRTNRQEAASEKPAARSVGEATKSARAKSARAKSAKVKSAKVMSAKVDRGASESAKGSKGTKSRVRTVARGNKHRLASESVTPAMLAWGGALGMPFAATSAEIPVFRVGPPPAGRTAGQIPEGHPPRAALRQEITGSVGGRTLVVSGDHVAVSHEDTAVSSIAGHVTRMDAAVGAAVSRGMTVSGKREGAPSARETLSEILPPARPPAVTEGSRSVQTRIHGRASTAWPPALRQFSGKITAFVARGRRTPVTNRVLRVSRDFLRLKRDTARSTHANVHLGMTGGRLRLSATAVRGSPVASSRPVRAGVAVAGPARPQSAAEAVTGAAGSVPGLGSGAASPQNGRPIPHKPGPPVGQSNPRATAFTSDISQLALRLASRVRPGETATVAVSISPAYLGELRITVSEERTGRLKVSIQADRDGARELLASRLHELREGLVMSGFGAISIDIGKREGRSPDGGGMRRGRSLPRIPGSDEFQDHLSREPWSFGPAAQGQAARSYREPAYAPGLFSGRA